MELKINIDESRFKDVLEKELAAFSCEELHELIRECIATALRDNSILQQLFVKTTYYSSKEPTAIVQKAAETFDLSPAFAEIQETMITELKTNYRALLERTMMGLMVQGLCDDGRFRSCLEETFNYMMALRNSNN